MKTAPAVRVAVRPLPPLILLLCTLALALGARGQVFKINCGGPALAGTSWKAEGAGLRFGGAVAGMAADAKAQVADAMYHDFIEATSIKKGDSFSYVFPVAKRGLYNVIMHFVEPVAQRPALRSFKVTVQSTITSTVQLPAFLVPVSRSIKANATDGTLTVKFENNKGSAALVAGIIVNFVSALPDPVTTTTTTAATTASTAATSTTTKATTTTTTTKATTTTTTTKATTTTTTTSSPRWVTRAPMPNSLDEVSTALIGTTVYLVGGEFSSMLAYERRTNSWTTLPGMPHPGNHHAIESYKGKLYVFAGMYSAARSKVQIFDSATAIWTFGPDIPWIVNGSCSSAIIGSQAYVCGGITNRDTINNCGSLDLELMEWSTTAPMPRGRNHAASGTDSKRLFIFGGRDGPNSLTNGFNEVQIFNPTTSAWQTSFDGTSGIPPLPIARGGMGHAAYVATTNEFYIMGGEVENHPEMTINHIIPTVNIYSVAQKTWRTGVAMLTPRHGIYPITLPSMTGGAPSIFVAGGGKSAGPSSCDTTEELLLG
jgi:N-acetylneuraminic acid mutarotase